MFRLYPSVLNFRHVLTAVSLTLSQFSRLLRHFQLAQDIRLVDPSHTFNVNLIDNRSISIFPSRSNFATFLRLQSCEDHNSIGSIPAERQDWDRHVLTSAELDAPEISAAARSFLDTFFFFDFNVSADMR